MNKIKIICKNFGTAETTATYVDVNENSMLLDIIEHIEGITPSLTFEEYYDFFITELMHTKRVLPYLSINGTVHWEVPYEDVLLKDFMVTHNINENEAIFIETGAPLASGIPLLAIKYIWEIFLGVISLLAVIKDFEDAKKIILSIYDLFTGKSVIPIPHTFLEAVLKERWNHYELTEFLGLDSPEKAKNLLKLIGYTWNPKEKIYYLPEEKIEKIKDELRNIDFYNYIDL